MSDYSTEDLLEQIRVLKKRIAELGEENINWERWRRVARTERDALEAENSYLKEIVSLCGVSDVNWKERTFRIKASPEKWFGVMGTRGEEK